MPQVRLYKLNFFKIIILFRFTTDEEVLDDINSNYDHYDTSIGKINSNSAIVVGSLYNKKVEIRTQNEWTVIDDFPTGSGIFSYSFANLNDHLYLFGKTKFFF